MGTMKIQYQHGCVSPTTWSHYGSGYKAPLYWQQPVHTSSQDSCQSGEGNESPAVPGLGEGQSLAGTIHMGHTAEK